MSKIMIKYNLISVENVDLQLMRAAMCVTLIAGQRMVFDKIMITLTYH